MQIEYLNHMGDDLMVVNAARVSFDKESSLDLNGKLTESDQKLLKYLAKHAHWTPFAHPQLQVRVTVPIFVANQLKRSTVGLVVNEISRRYVDTPPTFYMPLQWRGRPPKSMKQGSSDEVMEYFPDSNDLINYKVMQVNSAALDLYNRMIENGIAPEMARMVLPQSIYTSWYWTGSLMAFLRVYKQRSDSHSQKESQIIASQLGLILEKYFPESFAAWCNRG